MIDMKMIVHITRSIKALLKWDTCLSINFWDVHVHNYVEELIDY